jgi:tetratricopeptide (TPR) repeat protein
MKGQTSIAVVFACLIALATVHLHPVLAMDSSPAAKLHNHASMYLDLGEWQRARADYSEAIRLDSTNALYYNDRGLVYQLMRDYDHALADYGKAIEIDPTFVTAYNNRGMLYYGNKEYERAIADHERAIKINPQSSTAYRNLGNALFSPWAKQQSGSDTDVCACHCRVPAQLPRI